VTRLDNKFYLEADLTVVDSPSADLAFKATASDSLLIPSVNKQPDLLYNKAVFVSTGENKNGAYFLPLELYKAKGTIVNKAIDMEHDEQTIVGHIIDYAFMRYDRTIFNPDSLYKEQGEELFDKSEFDIGIVAVMHKLRFPEIAQEILDGHYGVSMEVLYSDYNIKVGDVIIPKDQAERSGIVKLIGQHVRVTHGSKPINGKTGTDRILRIFKNMLFYGCGYTKRPANSRSVILESASEVSINNMVKEFDVKGIPVFDKYVYEASKMEIRTDKKEVADLSEEDSGEEGASGGNMDSPTLEVTSNNNDDANCVSFKRHVWDRNSQEAGAQVVAENWCALFDEACPVAGASLNAACLRSVLGRTIVESVSTQFEALLDARYKRAADLLGVPAPEETTRVHAPGNVYNINQVKSEIKNNNVGEPIDNLITHSHSALASLDDSIAKADKVLGKSKSKE